jgi:ribosomal-protein-alanine N-acetyltransferase
MNLPPFNIFPTLSTEKIMLREILISDIPDIVEISFYDAKQAENVEQAVEMQERINQDYRNGNSIHWGISNRTTNKIMGTCGYYRGLETGTGELGCILLPMFRGQGIMTNAMKLAIDFGLNKIELNRIIAITSRKNQSAIKLLDRLNFIKVDDSLNEEIKFEFEAKLIKQ